jgi:hypothetical protein
MGVQKKSFGYILLDYRGPIDVNSAKIVAEYFADSIAVDFFQRPMGHRTNKKLLKHLTLAY